MAVLLCGGAGYIGSHVNKWLSCRGIDTIIFDNLVYGHEEAVKWGSLVRGDLAERLQIRQVFETNKIEAVLHFAAYAYVGESVREPEKYYDNNVASTLNLLRIMREYGCNKIIFSSSCATYGQAEKMPITEDMEQKPINPYGFTKYIVEKILKDYSEAYGLKYVILRYFNAAGADPDGEIGESHRPETHLIPLVLKTALGERDSIKVFGTDYDTSDGSCIRDYIHVCDLADAHARALDYLLNGGRSNCYNLGNETGASVLDIINTARDVTSREIKVEIGERRQGDPAILIGDSRKIRKELGWEPKYASVRSIIAHAWNWERNRNY